MASFSFNSLPLPPPSQPRKLVTETSFSHGALKPIVVSGNPPTFVSAPGRRIVAVGDLHGDLAQARSALEMAGVLSSDGQDLWTGGETVLVQLGDILDRGDDEIAILSLFRSLNIQAKPNGGAVFQLNGNHETMNVEGDYRYVESGAFDECADFMDYLVDCDYDWNEAFVSWNSVSERWKEDRRTSHGYWGHLNIVKSDKFIPILGQRQKGVIARSTLLRPGGPLACELAQHAVVLKIDDWVFCHGGLLPHHVAIHRSWIQSILEETLQAVGAKAMVVGHTPQTTGINSKYRSTIWRIDVGMSSGVLNSRPEALEIIDNTARVIRSKRDALNELQVVDYT
ncbi:hypothetical protein IFM89_025800 [Coptis chinensis]|uniref:Calcineurin-like phosphoesterase domain-containing protein n=1 Tax=Coptis chinensis TaxID=261450 RepID=A0A835HJT9_9MAGN|nr:hypothetical protein IFM89_025800 [Coptis chinensis]